MPFMIFVAVICECGWLMAENEGGYYCENSQCPLRTNLYHANAEVKNVEIPIGAAA